MQVSAKLAPESTPLVFAKKFFEAIQGKDCLVQKFRNSSVMLEHPSFRPKVIMNSDLYLVSILNFIDISHGERPPLWD
jgi:hypothetical protein